MKKTSGFTLSEVMVTLGVLGILAAIAIPVVMNLRPSEKRVMFKKAYFTLEKTVSDLINDDVAYPAATICTASGTGNFSGQYPCGFNNNTRPAVLGIPAANVAGTLQGKFCYLFSQKLNTITAVNCSSAATLTNGTASSTPSFTTSDGIQWFYRFEPFTVQDANYSYFIVDVNGTAGPNSTTKDNKQDRFQIGVRFDGKITVPAAETKAIEYLQSPTKND